MYADIIQRLLTIEDNLIGTECIVSLIRNSSERVYCTKLNTLPYLFKVQNPPEKSGYFLVKFIRRNLVQVIREANSAERMTYIYKFPSYEVVACEPLGKYMQDIWKCVYNKEFVLIGGINNVIPFQRIQCYTDYSGLSWMIAVNESTQVPEQYQHYFQLIHKNSSQLKSLHGTSDQEFLKQHILKEYVKIRTKSFEELMRYYVELNGCELVSYLELPNNRIRYHIRYKGESLNGLVTDREFRVIQAGFCVDGNDHQYNLSTICLAWKIRTTNIYEEDED